MKALEKSNVTRGLVAAGLTATCWSFLAIFIKIALKSSDAHSIVWYRMTSAFFLLGLFLLMGGRGSVIKTLWRPHPLLVACGFLLSINYLGFMKGVELTSPANAQIFIQLGPLLLALSGIFFFSEKLTPRQWMGLGLCVLGFSLFFKDKYQAASANRELYMTGQAWIALAALTWAIFGSLQKKLLQMNINTHQINLFIYGLATLLFVPTVDWVGLSQLSVGEHALLFFLGMNTLLAYGGLSVALSHLPASTVSPLLSLNPLVTLALIALLESLHWDILPSDPVSTLGYFGAIIAVFGVIVVLRSTPRKTRL